MKSIQIVPLFVLIGCWTPVWLHADEPAADAVAIQAAAKKSLALIERSSAEYLRQRVCFSCHHQAMAVLTLTESRRRGFAIDQQNLQDQLTRAAEHLGRGKENYLQGKGQGGAVDTAGYALWALEAGSWNPDETTEAVAEYLLQRDMDRDHWRCVSNRPPTESSDITTSAVALIGLRTFATDEQRERMEARVEVVKQWLANVEPKETEEHVFRLHALRYLDVDDQLVQAAADALIALRRDDGGWAQTAEMESDAYATGTALVVLNQVGKLPASNAVYQQGVQFLLDRQQEDGSWHVISRSKPFQTYFESGFPHGKDQFISMAASCWATIAIVLTQPEQTVAAVED